MLSVVLFRCWTNNSESVCSGCKSMVKSGRIKEGLVRPMILMVYFIFMMLVKRTDRSLFGCVSNLDPTECEIVVAASE